MFEVKKNYLSYNRPGTALNAEGAVCHSTATPGATDENEFTYYNGGNRRASAHTFIDWDSITETIPWTERANHAMPAANSRYIGVELCEPRDDDPDRFRKFAEVWKRASWYFADMFVKKGWSTDQLHSHKWVSETYKQSDHTDPYEYFQKYGKTFADFNDAVAVEMAAITKGVEIMLPVLIAFNPGGDGSDARAAQLLHDKLGAPVINRDFVTQDMQKSFTQVIEVGGGQKIPGSKLVSGNDRFDTYVEVLKVIGKVK